MPAEQFAEDAAAIGSLAEPIRRDLYTYVAEQADPVSRDQAAEALELPRHTVKFHLDKLVDEGLLTVHFRRLSGLSGPGAGRPSKLYSRSDREVALTVPARDYQVAAEIMAGAIETSSSTGTPILDATRAAARVVGAGVRGAETGEAAGDDPAARLCAALSSRGYQPRQEPSRITLVNCPFHRLAHDHTELVCSMNLELVDALVNEGLQLDLATRLEPETGRCCVVIDLPG